MRRGSNTSCSRPLLGRAVLVLLFAYLHAGLAMPTIPVEAADHIVDGTAALANKAFGKGKHGEVVKAFTRAVKGGYKLGKAVNKQAPAAWAQGAEAGTSRYAEFVSIAGRSPIPVATADITYTAAVRITGVGCGPATSAHTVATSIRLLGHGGTVVLGDFPSATYLPCPELPNAGRVRRQAVLGLGMGGELSLSPWFRTFSYLVSSSIESSSMGLPTRTQVLLGPVPPQQQVGGPYTPRPILLSGDPRYPGRYYVQLTGIRVGSWELSLSRTGVYGTIGESAYLSTDGDDTFTYLQSLQYNRLKLALQKKFFRTAMTVPASQHSKQLCYSAAAVQWPSIPPIALVFAGNVVMDVPAKNLWYNQGPNICLAILPARDNVSVLGSFLQKDRLMTISTQNNGISTLEFV